MELWEEYIKPAKERGEQMRKEMDKAKRGDDVFCPQTPAEIEQANAMMRALFGAPKE